MNCSSEIEGSQAPRLYRSFVDVAFGQKFVYAMLQKEIKTVLIATFKRDGHGHMRRVVMLVAEIVESLADSLLGEKYKPRILVDGQDEAGVVFRCELNELWEALDFGQTHVVAITQRNHRVTTPIKTFSSFFYETPEDLFGEERGEDYKYHAFLTSEGEKIRINEKTVVSIREISEKLSRAGINSWLDVEKIHVAIGKEIFSGCHSSKKVVIFLTKRYMEQLMDRESRAAQQFRYGMNFNSEDIIVVIIDPNLLDLDRWSGPVVEFNLLKVIHIDFSSRTRMMRNFGKLVRALRS